MQISTSYTWINFIQSCWKESRRVRLSWPISQAQEHQMGHVLFRELLSHFSNTCSVIAQSYLDVDDPATTTGTLPPLTFRTDKSSIGRTSLTSCRSRRMITLNFSWIGVRRWASPMTTFSYPTASTSSTREPCKFTDSQPKP